MKSTQLGKLFKILNLASCKVWLFLEHRKAFEFNFKIGRRFEQWKNIETVIEAWPFCYSVRPGFKFIPCPPPCCHTRFVCLNRELIVCMT
jgi:hypothetical protein